jgi:hypothetical protein
MKRILRYKLFYQAAIVGVVVLLLMLVSAHFKLNVITINTLTGTFFGGVFFTISIIFSGAMADFKEAEKIPGELAVLLKAMHADALLIAPQGAECVEEKDIVCHIEGLLSTINANIRGNHWHKSQLDEEINKINKDILDLWAKGVSPSPLMKLRDNMTNIDRLSHRIDYIAYTNDIPGAYVICDLSLATVLIIFVFAQNEWGFGGLLFFALITFVLTSIVQLIHDIDNPFEYNKNTVADVDMSVLFKLENFWKTGRTNPTVK